MNTSGYLDYAAATPVDPKVAEAIKAYSDHHFANPSSPHRPGRQARSALEEARSKVASVLGAKSREIIFTSSSTEAAHIAIAGVLGAFPDGEIAVAAIEHQAILQTALTYSRKAPIVIPCDPTGITSPVIVRNAISDTTVIVCVQYANNEVGTLQPIAKIAAEIAQVRVSRTERGIELPLYFYCDGAQAGLLNLQVNRLGVDLLSMGGSKIYGPPGSGFLYIRTGTQLTPLLIGGGQERGLRGGTENVPAAVGFSAALMLAQDSRGPESRRLQELRDGLWQAIQQTIEGVVLNGSMRHRLPGNLHLSFDGCAGEDLVAHLDAAGYAVATGSACTAAHQDPSHVLLAIGRSRAQAESSLRISLGRFTTSSELHGFEVALLEAVGNLRQHTRKEA